MHAPQSNCNVSGMKLEEGIELLITSAMVEHSEQNYSFASSIVKELGCLALAIVQAGAYIAKSCSLNEYLKIYKNHRVQLLQKHSVQMVDDYKWTVYTTWEMSMEKLSPAAATFLHLCAFLHYDGISKAIFQNAAAGKPRSSFKDAIGFLQHFQTTDGAWSDFQFHELINELASFSLININAENNIYSIHPLVHAWA